MKFKKVMLVSIFLLAVLTIGAVSASDVSDALAVEDNGADLAFESSVDEDVLSGDQQIDDEDISVDAPDEIKAYEEVEVNVTLPSDAEGYIDVYKDDEFDGDYYVSEGKATISFKFTSFGQHTVDLSYGYDDKYESRLIWSNTYDITDFVLDVRAEDVTYGDNGTMEVYLPDEASGNITLNINGRTYEKEIYGYNSFEVSDLKFADNAFTVTYSGNDEYGPKTYSGVLKTVPLILVNNYAPYNQMSTVNLTLPSNANGNLVVTFNGKKQTVKLVNGKASALINASLDLGQYDLQAYYDGSDYDVEQQDTQIEVCPNIVNPEYMWIKDIKDIVVEVPKTSKGTLYVDMGGERFAEITALNGKATLSPAELTEGRYDADLLYEDEVYQYGTQINFNIMQDSPDWDLNITIKNEILPGEPLYPDYTTPDEYSGERFIYIDGVETEDLYDLNLTLGEHTVKFVFTNDPYFKDLTKTMKFNVSNVVIEIPQEAEKSTQIEIDTAKDVTGNFTVFLDGKLYKTYIMTKAYYGDTDYGYYYRIAINDLDIKTYNVEVRYSGDKNHTAISKSGKMKVNYTDGPEIEISLDLEDKMIYFTLPADSTENLTVTIDGKAFNKLVYDNFPYYRGADLNISELALGKHTIQATYPGDSIYKNMTVSREFEIRESYDDDDGEINVKSNYSHNHGETYVSLRLPSNATGSLVVDFNGESHKSKLNNGYAKVSLGTLAYGKYTLSAYYDGSDYSVGNLDDYKFDVEAYYDYGGYDKDTDGFIYLELPSDATGNLVVTIDGEQYKKAALSNGKANITIKPSYGKHELLFSYDGDDYQFGYSTYEYLYLIYEETPLYKGEAFNFTLPADAKGKLTVKVNDAVYTPQIVKGNATLIPTSLTFRWNNITVTYDGDDYGHIEDEYSFWIKPKVMIGNGNSYIQAPLNPWAGATPHNYINASTSDYMTINLDSNFNGKYTVLFDDNLTAQGSFVKGFANISLANLNPGFGEIYIDYEYETGKHDFCNFYANVKGGLNLNVESDSITAGDVASVKVTANSKATGSVLISVANSNYTAQLVNGAADVSVANLTEGSYVVKVKYLGDANFGSEEVSTTLTVAKKTVKPKLVAKDLTMQYSDGSKFTVKVYGTDGKLAKNVNVVIKINGKKVKTVKTNTKGVATYKITNTPKTYKITAQALGASVTKKLTVKQILTVKSTAVKKSAKKVVLTATLKKVKGKYLKGKVIKFKFNGKTYTAKTNKKGVAKVTVKNAVLKKLKVGKKITYQATYLKDTVKKSVKVKK